MVPSLLACACAGPEFSSAPRDDNGSGGGVAGALESAGSSGARTAGGGVIDHHAHAGSSGSFSRNDDDEDEDERTHDAGRTAGGNGGRASAGCAGAAGAESAGAGGIDSVGAGGLDAPETAGAAGSSETARAGAAGAGAGGAGDAGGAPGESGDHMPPYVVAVEPEPDAKGVAADAVVRVTFSEAMSTIDFQQALDASDLADDVFLKWNEDATILTIRPERGLTYARGSDPVAGTAQRFDFVIGVGAHDLAGNGLEAPFESGFWTLRRITQQIACRDACQIQRNIETALQSVTHCHSMTAPSIPIGPAPQLSRAYVAVDIAVLLKTASSPYFELERAELYGVQGYDPTASPATTYDDYGPLQVDELTYQVMALALLDVSGTTLGDFAANPDVAEPRLDITEALRQDVSEGIPQLLYAIHFPQDKTALAGNTFPPTRIDCSPLGVEVTYLIE